MDPTPPFLPAQQKVNAGIGRQQPYIQPSQTEVRVEVWVHCDGNVASGVFWGASYGPSSGRFLPICWSSWCPASHNSTTSQYITICNSTHSISPNIQPKHRAFGPSAHLLTFKFAPNVPSLSLCFSRLDTSMSCFMKNSVLFLWVLHLCFNLPLTGYTYY